jgi:hypothetical protein
MAEGIRQRQYRGQAQVRALFGIPFDVGGAAAWANLTLIVVSKAQRGATSNLLRAPRAEVSGATSCVGVASFMLSFENGG